MSKDIAICVYCHMYCYMCSQAHSLNRNMSGRGNRESEVLRCVWSVAVFQFKGVSTDTAAIFLKPDFRSEPLSAKCFRFSSLPAGVRSSGVVEMGGKVRLPEGMDGCCF